MITIGLTGSIGTGKSTVANMFRDLGIPVFDADGEVHRLYGRCGAAVAPINDHFPGVVKNGAIDRHALARAVTDDATALEALEVIVHPLVREGEAAFLQCARAKNARFVVLEIQLLFETGSEARVDVVVVVSAPADIQRQRVLTRPGMSEDKFKALMARQIPDDEKRARADFVIDTGTSLDKTRHAVRAIVEKLDTAIADSGEQHRA